MKFLILATLLLSIEAQQAQPGKLKNENLLEEMAEMKINLAEVEMKMTRMETNVADLQQSMREIISLFKNGGKISEGLVVPDNDPENNSAEYLEEDVSIATGGKSASKKMNDTDLEQRVQILEIRMTTVIDDVTDVDTRLTQSEADVALIEVDQNSQDARINELLDVVVAQDTRLDDLESLNLTEELNDLDSRLDKQELSGSIAFHVLFLADVPTPEGTPVVFDTVNYNYGSGYNPLTGEFTTPLGGAGLYYFYFHFEGFPQKRADIILRRNTIRVCDAINGRSDSIDFGTKGCGAVVQLNEGDIVDVFNFFSTDDRPAYAGNAKTTFSGFRIAPE